MFEARLRKVIADIWLDKRRSMLVVLTLVASLTAIGIILTAREQVAETVDSNMTNVVSAHVRLDADPFAADVLAKARAHPQVGKADGRYRIDTRATAAQSDDAWRNLRLFAIDDFETMQVNRVFYEDGTWPPAAGEVALERATATFLNVGLGDSLVIESETGSPVSLVVGTLVYDPFQITPVIGNEGYAYIVQQSLAEFGIASPAYTELYVRGAEAFVEKAQSQALATALRTDVLEASGLRIFRAFILAPDTHPLGDLVDVLLTLLLFLAATTLLMSGFLVINTMVAILTEQTRQIGVMKALGAKRKQLVGMYLALALLYGVAAVLPTLLLSYLGGWGLTKVILGFLNLDAAPWRFMPLTIGILFALGVFLPLVVAYVPIRRTVKVSVRDAICSGGSDQLGKRRFVLTNRWAKKRNYSRLVLLIVRNSAHNRTRLVLTLLAFSLSGAMFVSMMAVRASMTRTIDDMANYWQYDIEISLNESYLLEDIRVVLGDVLEVAEVEGWLIKESFFVRPDGSENENLWLLGPPSGSKLLEPMVLEGRWLAADAVSEVVVNTDFLRDEPDIEVGDVIGIRVDSQLTEWEVVGVVSGQISGPVLYVNYETISAELGISGLVNRLAIKTTAHDEAAQSLARQHVETRLRDTGFSIGLSNTNAELRAKLDGVSDVFYGVILAMIALLATAAGLSLAGTLSLNVLDRTRDIGVLRAIGASNAAIRQLVLLEALVIALLSWLAGILFGVPLSKLLSDLSGVGFINAPLNYSFPGISILLWLVLALLLSLLASWLPASRAAALNVREALSYE